MTGGHSIQGVILPSDTGPLGVARGIKGSGTGLTFDPLQLLSDLQKISE